MCQEMPGLEGIAVIRRPTASTHFASSKHLTLNRAESMPVGPGCQWMMCFSNRNGDRPRNVQVAPAAELLSTDSTDSATTDRALQRRRAQPDDGGVDVPHFVRSRRAPPQLRLRGMEVGLSSARPNNSPCTRPQPSEWRVAWPLRRPLEILQNLRCEVDTNPTLSANKFLSAVGQSSAGESQAQEGGDDNPNRCFRKDESTLSACLLGRRRQLSLWRAAGDVQKVIRLSRCW